jgi:hypothetical protein
MANTPDKENKPKINGIPTCELCVDDLPNATVDYTPDGTSVIRNFTEGRESYQIQHRTGALLQMSPDGSMVFKSANGNMGFEMSGDGYVRVTGKYNVICEGDAGFNINGKCDWNVSGDMNIDVSGNMTQVVGKSMNMVVAEKLDVGTRETSMVSGKTLLTSAESTKVLSGGTMKINASDDMTVHSGGNINATTGGNINLN